MDNSNVKKILVVELAGIGDLVMATPALKALREKFPDAYVGILVIGRAVELAEGLPYVNEVFVFDIEYTGIDNLFRNKAVFKTYKTIRELHCKRFDLLINLEHISTWPGALKMAALFSMIGARYKLGRDTDGRGFFFNLKVPESVRDHKHEVEANLEVVRLLGADVSEVKLEAPVFDEDRKYVDDFFSAYDLGKKYLLIGLNPGSFRFYDRWPCDRWVRLCECLIEKYKCIIVVTGGESEKGLVGDITTRLKDKPVVPAINFTLKQLAALIERLDLFITGDSGPMHIAAAAGTRLIALFGPGDVHKFSPYTSRDKYIIIRKEINCPRPCYKFKCQNNQCMGLITVQDVSQAAEELLK
ncbi:MAG: glycosyltransferase family 9 protein [Candidatus Omnitrophota bacterium]